MRNVTATVALLATMYASAAVLPAVAQERSLEGLVEDALEGTDTGVLDEDVAVPEAEWFSDEELEELVAPVALYPDALLAQVLVASTFPLQIVKADRILDASEDMTDDELTEEIEAQVWDPSVLVLLTGFPTVVQRMADDLEETEQLGIAMAQQDQDLLAAVQRMRARAEETGYLESNEAHIVEREGDQIYIEPADPEVIYVPQYDSTAAFTSAPTAPPVYTEPRGGLGMLSNPVVAGAIGFGSALLIDEFFGDESDDDDDEGWDDYWHRRRAIDWREREVYPRPYWTRDDGDRRRQIAWREERDHYWDWRENEWRREAQQARREAWRERREARVWQVRRDPDTGMALFRPRDWRDAEPRLELRRAAEERRERQEAAERERQRERREAAEWDERRERRQEAQQEERRGRREEAQQEELRERRQEAQQEERRERRQEAQQEERRERRQEAQQEERREDPAARQAAEERRKREAAEREKREQGAARREAEERQEQKAERARREEREQAAEEQREREAAAARRKAAEEQQERQQAAEERRQRAAAEEQRQRAAAEREERERAAERRQERRAAPAREREGQRRDCSELGSAAERRACRRGQ